jgi:hypothetical protein
MMQQRKRASLNFSQIYSLAKDGKQGELKALQLSGHSLDVMDATGMYTPAMQLAAEGNKKAVSLLVNLGVNIDKVAKGFAIKGDYDEVQLYHTQHGANPDEIGAGLAMGNFHVRAQAYITYHHADPARVADGYAYINNQERIRKYIELYKSKIDKSTLGMMSATAGYSTEANSYSESDNETNYLITIGHVIANNQHEIQAYLQQEGHDKTNIGYAHALAGRAAKASLYCTDDNATAVTKGFAASGHNMEVEEYRKKYNVSVDAIASMYAFMERLHEVVVYCTQHKADLSNLIPSLAAGLFRNAKVALRNLAFIEDDVFRNQLATALDDSKLLRFNVKELASRAKAIHSLMRGGEPYAKASKELVAKNRRTYDQAKALSQTDVQGWYLYGAQDVESGNLANEMFYIIAGYLAPLTRNESADLYNNPPSFVVPDKKVAAPPATVAATYGSHVAPRSRRDMFMQKHVSAKKTEASPTPVLTTNTKTVRFTAVNNLYHPGKFQPSETRVLISGKNTTHLPDPHVPRTKKKWM